MFYTYLRVQENGRRAMSNHITRVGRVIILKARALVIIHKIITLHWKHYRHICYSQMSMFLNVLSR